MASDPETHRVSDTVASQKHGPISATQTHNTLARRKMSSAALLGIFTRALSPLRMHHQKTRQPRIQGHTGRQRI